MISSTSRYVGSSIDLDDTRGGRRQVVTVPIPPERVFNFTYYQVVDGEQVDLLADRFFGESTKWWLLADANPEILDWHHLPAGTVLRVPVV